MSIEEKYELFDACLENKLSSEEQLLFNELMTDAAVEKEFEEYRQVQISYQKLVANEEKEKLFIHQLKNIASQYDENIHPQDISVTERTSTNTGNENLGSKPALQVSRNIRWILSAAAVLILGVFLVQYLFPQKKSMHELYAANYSVEKLSVERGENNDSLRKIVELYNAGHYSIAIPHLQEYTDAHPSNMQLKLALAISCSEMNKDEQAERKFNEIIQLDNDYKEKAQWYLAMLYLKQGNQQKTTQLLQQFDKDHFYYKQAQEILKKMK